MNLASSVRNNFTSEKPLPAVPELVTQEIAETEVKEEVWPPLKKQLQTSEIPWALLSGFLKALYTIFTVIVLPFRAFEEGIWPGFFALLFGYGIPALIMVAIANWRGLTTLAWVVGALLISIILILTGIGAAKDESLIEMKRPDDFDTLFE
jgi:tellurite resistance protein TehA-like permease